MGTRRKRSKVKQRRQQCQTVGMDHCISCHQVNFFVQQTLKIMIVNMQNIAPMSLQRTFHYCQVGTVRWTPSHRWFEVGCKAPVRGRHIHRADVLWSALKNALLPKAVISRNSMDEFNLFSEMHMSIKLLSEIGANQIWEVCFLLGELCSRQ